MRIVDFLSDLHEKVDAAVVCGALPEHLVASYVAPSSGFCGPTIRPRYLGDNAAGEGRYGLTLEQSRKIIAALTGQAPPATKEEQIA